MVQMGYLLKATAESIVYSLAKPLACLYLLESFRYYGNQLVLFQSLSQQYI